MRTILTFVVFFAAGLLTAGTYFYGRHPQHSPLEDVPRFRRDVEDVIERGRKLHEAWQNKGEPDAPESEPEKTAPRDEPPEPPARPAAKPPRDKGKKKTVER